MLRTVTQKCPCGYLFKESNKIEQRTTSSDIGFSCDTVKRNNSRRNSHKKEPIVEHKIINGDEEFKKISVLTGYDPISGDHQTIDLLLCPKCGTVLMPEIAMNVEETEE